MAINQSKKKDLRFWKKWKKSGAIGTEENTRKKSDIRLKLEKQGWEFLTNEFGTIATPMTVSDGFTMYWLSNGPLPSDIQLIQKYKERGFKEVRIEQAFDIYGKFLDYGKAVYIKRY